MVKRGALGIDPFSERFSESVLRAFSERSQKRFAGL